MEVTGELCKHVGSLGAFITILKNQKYPGERLLSCVLVTNRTVSSDPVSRSGSGVVVWWTRGCPKPWLLCATFLWQTLSTGLALRDVQANGEHLTRSPELLCLVEFLFLVSSVEMRWEKHLLNVTTSVCHCTLPSHNRLCVNTESSNGLGWKGYSKVT